MTWSRVTTTAFAVTALLLASCSDDDSPAATSPQSPEPAVARAEAEFAAEAATVCTQVVNDAVAGPGLPSPHRVVAQVLAALGSDRPATAAELSTWAGMLDRHLALVDSTRERLATVAAPTDELQARWRAVLAAYDGPAEVQRQRADALRAGSWPEVRVAFGVSSSSSELEPALDDLDLATTDCAHVFSPDVVQPPAQWRQFTVAAAEACTRIANRRLLSGFTDDNELVLDAVEQATAGDLIDDTDRVDAALGRVVTEWRQTADDFSAVDATGSPSPSTWRSLADLAAERVAVAEQRRAAIATSNDAAMAAAFAVPDYAHTSFGFELLLLEARSCGGLTT